MAKSEKDRALESDRAFMEEWCAVCGNYTREYYMNLPYEELEREYQDLVVMNLNNR